MIISIRCIFPLILSVLLQIRSAYQCGVPQQIKNQLIVNADETFAGQWPWHAALYHRRQSSEKYACGGTLISEWFVLSAAHCTLNPDNRYQLPTSALFVRLGVHNLQSLNRWSLQQHDIDAISKPDGFHGQQLRDDIALLKLSTKAEYDQYIQPACLNQKLDLTGESGTAIGWGLTEHNRLSAVLKSAQLPVIEDVKCLASDRVLFGNVLEEGIFCAGHTNGTAVCNGDSGGGLFFQRGGAWYLGGIISFSSTRDTDVNLCNTKGYGAFTKVTKYLQWIKSVVGVGLKIGDKESADAQSAIALGRVVVCYISTWAVYRSGSGAFNVDHFDPKLCTHVIYAYAGLDVENNTIKSLDRWRDLKDNYGMNLYEKLVDTRKSHPHLKVLISMGGWGENSAEYSKLAADPERRRIFVDNALGFIKRYGFDGLDLNWEYPTMRGGKPYDRENFVQLTKELSQKFKRNQLLLTSTIEARQYIIDAAYDIRNLSKYLDLLHVKCYDYKGSWNKKIGFNAPLKGNDVHNIESSIDHLISLGAPTNKIVLGLPFYGRTFIADSVNAQIGDPSDEVGFKGPYTNENGFIGYNEICVELKARASIWQVSWNPEAAEAIAKLQDGNRTKVIVYDSTRSMATKVRYAMRKNLRGLMTFSIDTDDFNGVCSAEKETFADFSNQLQLPAPVQDKYKLLRTINDAIVLAFDEMNQEG